MCVFCRNYGHFRHWESKKFVAEPHASSLQPFHVGYYIFLNDLISVCLITRDIINREGLWSPDNSP